MPVPVSSASAIIIYTIGTHTPDAVKANCPTSGMWAIQIRSTTLFSNMSSCCNTTGNVIVTNSLRMGSVPNLWSVKSVNNMPRLWRAGLMGFRFRLFLLTTNLRKNFRSCKRKPSTGEKFVNFIVFLRFLAVSLLKNRPFRHNVSCFHSVTLLPMRCLKARAKAL